jgi:alpha-mannosidase
VTNHADIRLLRVFAVLLAVMISFIPYAKAAPKTVWQIGTFNESPSEFRDGDSSFVGVGYPTNLLYIVGRSTPGADWAARQMGSASLQAGGHPRPYTIRFDLDELPQGNYILKIGLLSEFAAIGQLQIEINGHAGLFYLHPKRNYSGGTREMVTSPIAAAETIRVDLPARYFKRGTNNLVLTAVDAPSEAGSGVHSVLTYDALELDHDGAEKFAAEGITAEVEPTIFYTRQGSGSMELVDVFVRHNAPVNHGQISLSLKGRKFSAEMYEGEFGEQRAEFSVPEFTTSTEGVVTVQINGRSRRFPVTLTPARKWNLLIVPHVHLDVGYTDYQAKVGEIQSRELDEAMDLIREHPAFRFSPDGYWSVRQYMTGRSEDRQQQLFQMVKDKKLFVPTVEASLLTGFPSLETLIRSLYPASEFHQKHGGDIDYADITDVPSYSWSYSSVLAAAGLKYLVAGCDGDNGPILLYSQLNEKSPFWWEGPDGNKVLMWYSVMYQQLNYLFGGYQGRLATGRESLPRFFQNYSRPDYKADSVIVYGSQVENTDLFPQQAEIADSWNTLYAYPHFTYSGFADALSTIAQQFGDSIPVVRGDGGPYWEYGIASTALSAAIAREAEQRAPAAEEFSTVSGLVNPALRADSKTLKQLWENLVLYSEHTWGSARSVSDPKSQETVDQLAIKNEFATNAARDVDYVLRRGLAGLANSISEQKGTLLAFNPLSWQRSNLVEMDLDKGREIVDLVTQRTVPYQVLFTGESYRHVRFLAQDVPSVGYRAYELRQTTEEPAVPPAVSGETMENRFYRVVLDPASGAVKSIFDKDQNKEMINASGPYRFDQYLYVTGGDKTPNRLVEYSSGVPIPDLNIHAAGGGKIVSITHEPFGVVARLESSGVNAPKIETEIILSDDQKKIICINHVHKTEVYTKEAAYFAFPFAMDRPHFRYEIQNGVVNPEQDQMPGAGKEWFSVQHWVAADQDGVTAALVPIDSSLVNLGDIQRGTWPKLFGKRTGTVFSEIMNNYYFTNYAAGQGGDFTFRYVFTSGNSLQPGYLSRFGREEMSPLEVDQITSQDKAVDSPRPLAGRQGSFLKVDQPGVALVTWKNAENGDGVILRFVEIAGRENEVNVESQLLDVKAAWITDALERNQSPLTTSSHGFRLAVKPFQIVTVRLEGTGNLK